MKIMKISRTSATLILAGSLPAFAIEPPVESVPVPPQEPAKPVPSPADLRKAVKAPDIPEGRQGMIEEIEIVEEAHPGQEAVPIPIEEIVEDRPYIGVVLGPVPAILAEHLKLDEGVGFVIQETVPGGPSDLAGIQANDILLDVNGTQVGLREEVRDLVEQNQIGDEVKLGVLQKGERKEFSVTLAPAPHPPIADHGMAQFLGGGLAIPLEGAELDKFLQDFPNNRADAIRDALELNLRQFEGFHGEAEEMDGFHQELMQRLQREMGGGKKLNFGIDSESTVRFMDDEGSIEMKSSNGNREARAYDKEGNLLWEGPYDTEQDKAAVPDGIRERLGKLNFDFHEGAFQLKMFNPERFRGVDEIEPAVEADPADQPEPPDSEEEVQE